MAWINAIIVLLVLLQLLTVMIHNALSCVNVKQSVNLIQIINFNLTTKNFITTFVYGA